MQILVLGSSAGGGFPQWNCHCLNCSGILEQRIDAHARTQSSIAVSMDGENWLLINASPDIRQQILQNPQLQSNTAIRSSAIQSILLIDSQIDHTSGLLFLRESSKPLPIYSTSNVQKDLTTGFPILELLKHYCGSTWHEVICDGRAMTIPELPNLILKAYPVPGKAPPYSPNRHNPAIGDNIALLLEDAISHKRCFYAPGLGGINDELRAVMKSADLLLIDGTFWTEDEMVTHGINTHLAAQMGHLPQSGEHGSISLLDTFEDKRKILIHINNTNPILRADSPERAILSQHGITVAEDGMQITL